ncbi:MAG TPA: sugar ABC transporter permease [Candidatus Dormibacteraeota bacterium]|nr:sugar ABC transporter permease [Candidatus Dormibacteraeota bacterium]
MSAQQALVAPVPRARPAARRGSLREALTGWLFSAPFLLIFLGFLALPILASAILSFTDFSLGNLVDPLSAHFVGLSNYAKLLHDPNFLQAALTTAIFVVFGTVLNLAVGLAAAVALNRGINRFRAVFRVGYYLPVVSSIVAIAVIWRFLFNADFGVVNGALQAVGIKGPDWLGNPNLAVGIIVALMVWRNFGNAMIIFLAGLQGIPNDLYEAARIDGANRWQEFRSITLPMLKPTTLLLTVVTTIGFLQVFEEPFVMTQGGPLNRTRPISMYVYQQGFNFFHQGYASAMAYTLFVVIAAVTLIQFRLLRSQT